MKELQKILEQKLEGLIAKGLEDYRSYASLVRKLSPEQAEPNEDCANLIAKKISQVYNPNEQLEKIYSFLGIFNIPLRQASLLGPRESWEGTWMVLFGSGADYDCGLRHPGSFQYVKKVHEAYQKRVGSISDKRAGLFRIIQQKVMPVNEELADVAYAGILIENPEWHLRKFLEFTEENRKG